MFIAIDIGNLSINIGFFAKSRLFVTRINTKPFMSPEECSELLSRSLKEKLLDKQPAGSIISSVVPKYTGIWREALRGFTSVEPLLVSYRMNTGLTFTIPNPEHLGSDRIANAVAAHERYKCPAAAVDVGTATTISITGAGGTYIGGAILPGIQLMKDSLAQETATLPEISLVPPETALGVDTTRCIQSGLFYGTAGAIERIIKESEKAIGLKLKVVVTGGFSGLVHEFLKKKHVLRPHLTLEGLKILYIRNTDA